VYILFDSQGYYATVLLTDWLLTFVEIAPNNHTNVANKEILYTMIQFYECKTPLSRPVVVGHGHYVTMQ